MANNKLISPARLVRLQKVRRMVINGTTRYRDIAAALGIPKTEACLDLMWVLREMRIESKERAEYERDLGVQRYLHSANKAMVGFEESRKPQEDVTTAIVPTACEDCHGSGMAGEEQWCRACQGDGVVSVERVTRRVKGQAGDPGFLRAFNEAVNKANQLMGIIPDGKRDDPAQVLLQQNNYRVDLSNCPAALLLEARKVIERLRASGDGKVLEAVVVEEPVNKENKE